MRQLLLFIVAAVVFASCSNNSAKIKGTFSNMGGKTIYLERLEVGESEVVDSVKASKDGDFKFTVKFKKEQQPTFYLVKVDGDNFITIFVERGDKIKLTGDAKNLENTYDVKGSKTSMDIHDLSKTLNSTIHSLDSLDKLRGAGVDSIDYKMGHVFVNCKREFIKYMVTNPKSMASLYAIYSQIPGNTNIFGLADDVNYFKLLSDSLSVVYPKSPYVISLKKHYSQLAGELVMNDLLTSKGVETVGVPDIKMKNQHGQEVKLSSLKGKVVLLDFWDPAQETSLENNLGLVSIYNKFKDRGFEIYQVSLSTKAPWLAAVQRQNLQWICVSDFLGQNSAAAMVYNVKSIPANFLIDRKGDLVGRNIFGKELEASITKALK